MSEHGTFLASTAADLTVCVTWRYPKKTWEHSYKGSDVHICVVGTGLDHRVPADHLLASSSLLFHHLSLLSLFFIIYIYFSVFIFTLFEPHRHTFESSSYGNPNPIRLLYPNLSPFVSRIWGGVVSFFVWSGRYAGAIIWIWSNDSFHGEKMVWAADLTWLFGRGVVLA